MANESPEHKPADSGLRYDAFISYSHRGERELARSLERTLWTFGRAWYQLRRIRTFRDETNLAAEPELWPSIERAVRQSSHLVLLTSPDAARSEWIPREVATAMTERGIQALCVVQTAGVLPWTDKVSAQEMLARADGALPPAVWELFESAAAEPLVVDLRPFRHLSEPDRRNNPDYLSNVASIAAKVLDKDKELLWGEYHRAQRLRAVFLGGIALVLLALVAALGIVLRAEITARRETEVALAGSYFREAVTRLEGERPFEGIAYAARAVTIDPSNKAARTLALEMLLWRPWPRFSLHTAAGFTHLALSSQGRLLLAASKTSASVYDIASGAVRGQSLVHQSSITAVAVAADGTLAATADANGEIRVWALGRTNVQHHVWSLRGPINALVFSRDGRRLSAAGQDGAQVWDTVTGVSLGPRLARGGIASVEFGHKDKWLVITEETGGNGVAEVWDYQHGARIGKPFDTGGSLSFACLDETGRLLMTSSYGAPSFARVWKVDNGMPVSPPLIHKDFPIQARFLNDGRQLLTVSRDGSGRVWDVPKGGTLPRAEFTHEGTLWTAAISPDGWWVATGASDGAVHVWDRRTAVRRPLTLPLSGPATAGALSSNGRFAAALTDSDVWLTETSTGTAHRIQIDVNADHLAIRNDGQQIALTSRFGPTFLLNTSPVHRIQTESRRPSHTQISEMPTFGLFYGSLGELLVDTYGADADLLDTRTGRRIGKPLHHEDIIRSVSFSPDDEQVVTSSRDGTVRVWNAHTGDPIASPFPHGEATIAASFTLDANRVISASRDGLIWSWDVPSQRLLSRVPLRGVGLIGSAAFSRDGARVVTTDYATAVRVWDSSTGLPLTAPLGDQSPVVNVRLSDDGMRLLTVGGGVSVWDLPRVTRGEAPVFSKWAEAVAGMLVIDSVGLRSISNAPAQVAALRREAEEVSKAPLPIWKMVRWFFADPWKRTISPLSQWRGESTDRGRSGR